GALPSRRAEAPARRARLAANRPRAPALVPLHARALAADPRRRAGARDRVTRGRAYALVAAVCALPRLAVLLHERDAIVTSFTEKSWDFAQTFVNTGTFGFIGGIPSANTHPLCAFFLIPIVWLFHESWLAVGLAQIAVAVGVALLVYEIGRRVTSSSAALVAAVIATLQPYLVWHDVHLNREIVDQL